MAELSKAWLIAANTHGYSYNFEWLGVKVIQFPQDMMAMQEIVWKVKPDLIIETGVAKGGMLIFYASLLELLGGNGLALGIEVELRPDSRTIIRDHPMAKRIQVVEGSSTFPEVVSIATEYARNRDRVIVSLDSSHEHAHVLEELRLYSPLVRKGGYVVVFDTAVDDMPADFFPDRPWGPGNSPKTAVTEFLKRNDRFVIDRSLEEKLLVTTNPNGYLLCVKD
ncbi:MAG: CmcI family methyltransferase [Thermodesulfobacteriota bacterium]